MNITILAVGTKMPRWVSDGYDEYAKRFGKDVKLSLKEIKPEKRGSGVNAAQGMAAEEARILAALPNQCFLVVLDERGQAPTSVQLADHLKHWQHEGHSNVYFVIGGADGMTDALKKRANMLMRLSNLTMPHGMVRVLLAEQLYRAVSIMNNHPYHRE
ncbi:MAG: 23S rRNA (pseudouridine(1915)-N(3))-methyltransferase RlmH [Neisseriaceae bacterium]|nr:23S rRNA (pseudouridine(1915)-N(3))-methyltransferase RlmH [Neisseriaceae bacterium]MBP6863064.1 23S rRNA (pseudouridine(1915)-N(3))-methyltransferase RlmH [Neisseriaceae bacterium]